MDFGSQESSEMGITMQLGEQAPKATGWGFPGSYSPLLWLGLAKGGKRKQRMALPLAGITQLFLKVPPATQSGLSAHTSYLCRAWCMIQLGFAGRAAGSCKEQLPAFAQQHDSPWPHFLHPCSQQDPTTF